MKKKNNRVDKHDREEPTTHEKESSSKGYGGRNQYDCGLGRRKTTEGDQKAVTESTVHQQNNSISLVRNKIATSSVQATEINWQFTNITEPTKQNTAQKCFQEIDGDVIPRSIHQTWTGARQ